MRHIRIIAGIASLIVVPFLSATQVIPHQVNPQIGQNLWQMNYNQSITIDDILDTTTLCCNCDYFITQADIDLNGGGFTITQPGNWCLAENIITSQPIDVQGSGITLDLKGRTISSTVVGGIPFFEVDTCPGIIIKDGNLVGLDIGATAGTRIGIRFTNSPNCLIENIRTTFSGSVDVAASGQRCIGFAADTDTSSAIFRGCFVTGPFLTGFTTSANDTVFSNCEVNHFSGDLVLGGLNPGLGYFITGSNCYLENCKSIGGDAQPSAASAGSSGFVIEGNNICLNGCVALDHRATTTLSLSFVAGCGFLIDGNNCEIRNSFSSYNQAFGILNNGIGLIVCNNSVHDNAIDFSGTSDSNLCKLIIAASGCDFMITQDDIGAGGIYTITQPGKYCLAEAITYTASNAITINSPHVVLDLQEFPMVRTALNTSPSTTGAVVCNQSACIIENGDINADTIIVNEEGIIVRNCTLDGNVSGVSGIVLSLSASNCQVLNCSISNALTSTGITMNGNNNIVDGCLVNNTSEGIAINGTRSVIQNCVLKANEHNGLFATPFARITTVESCLAEFNQESGIRIDGPLAPTDINSTVNNCIARFNSGSSVIPSFGVVVGLVGHLQAHYSGVGVYTMFDDYRIRVTNSSGFGNGTGDMIMVLDITDPAVIQPPIFGTQRLISPSVGIVTSNTGALLNDTTAGSTNATPPVSPGVGSNLSLG